MFWIVLGLVIGWWLFRPSGQITEPCERHTWAKDLRGGHYCTKCNQRAG